MEIPARVLFVSALSLLSFSTPSSAQQIDGNELFETCIADNMAMQGFCLGYIIGQVEGVPFGTFLSQSWASDGNISTEKVNEITQQVLQHCIPENADNRQLTDVVLGYLSRHPEKRHETARGLIWEAMREAFPCE